MWKPRSSQPRLSSVPARKPKVGKDIEIVFTDAIAGEEMFEELLTSDEGTQSSEYEKIFVAQQATLSDKALRAVLLRLEAAARARDGVSIRSVLLEVIPGATVKAVNPRV